MQQTSVQRAYSHLRGKLVSGEFSPGTRIRYGPVGKELGFSATPVREAIGQLANEGFVQLVPQLGAVVRELGSDELIELYEMREALEPYAAARAAERISERQREELCESFERMKSLAAQARRSGKPTIGKRVIQQFEAADLTFHMTIIEATGNRRMIKSVGTSHVLARIFSTSRHAYDVDVMAGTCGDHDAILQALIDGNADGAREAMARHIRNSLKQTLDSETRPADRWWGE